MRFIKMHGIGNDYVYVNGFEETVDEPAALARVIADRHTGVGGDGLVLVLPAGDGVGADVRMRMFNADGSEAEMCGNAIRCVCMLAHDRGLTDAKPMRVQTGNGVLTLDYTLGGDGKVDGVTVDMGEPILVPAEIPIALEGENVIDYPIGGVVTLPAFLLPPGWREACGLDERITGVSMGNPHVTLYCEDVSRVPLDRIGPVLENHELFPNRINVHVVQVHDAGEVTMRTWERGSGITLACGTGACAVAVAGVLTGRTGRELLAHLPGGDLTLRWDEATNHVFMTGPAAEVFTGEWPTD